MAERTQFLKQSGIAIIGNVLAAALAVLYVSVFSHRITASEYALVASALSLSYIASLILIPLESDVAHLSAICHGQSAPEKLRSVAERALAHSVRPMLLALIVWVPFSMLLKAWLHFPTLAPLLLVGVFFALSFPATILRGIFRGDRRFFAYSVSQVVESGVRFVGGLAALQWGLAASGAIMGYALGMAAAVALGLWQLRDLSAFPSTPLDSKHERMSWPLLLFCFYLPFVMNADVLAAKHYLDPREAGHYGAAATLSRMVFIGAAPIYQVLFSYVVAHHTRGESSRRLGLWAGTGLTGVLLAGLIIPILFGRHVLALVFGADYAAAAPVLRIVWLSTSLVIFEALVGFFLIGRGWLKGGSSFLVPCIVMATLVLFFHGSAVEIAKCGFTAVLAGGAILAWTAFRSPTS